ncbi:MAG: oxidoreductase, partial [Alphaproteobacteria bacterium]
MPNRLFSPFTLCGLTLPNRIVVSPMAQYSGTTGNEATDWHLMHYGNFSVSGAGLMFFEATAVEPRGRVGRFDLGLWNDAQQDSIARVIAFCRQHGQAKIAMQLAHSGRKGSTMQPWMGGKYIGPEEGGFHPISPGDIAFPGRPAPR